MPNNKSLIYLFNKIYNGGDLINIITTITKIKSMNKYYKNNFTRYDNFEELLFNMGSLRTELEKSHSALAEFEKQYNRNLALQPAILTECFISQTLANILGLNNFLDADENEENIPGNLLMALIRSKGGDLEAATPRYIYYNDNSSIVLLQYGDSSSIDAVFVKNGYRVRLEIKEEKAKLGEYDLNYNEEGVLIPTRNIINNHPEYIKFIDVFNNTTDMFSHMGSNFKIGSYLEDDLLNSIVDRVFALGRIDLYILQKGNKIFAVPSNNLLKCVDVTKGSEIRTAGRNSYAVFTPDRLMTFIHEQGGTIENNIVTLAYDQDNETEARGGTRISRYKINSLFFVPYQFVTIENNFVSFDLTKVKQNKATIAIHLNAEINEDALRESFEELNS